MGDTSELTERPLRVSDRQAVLALINAAEAASPLPLHTDASDLEDEWAEPGLDLETDSLGLFDGDDLVGWITTAKRPDQNPIPCRLDHGAGSPAVVTPWRGNSARRVGSRPCPLPLGC